MGEYHQPVLLEESVEGLNINPDGIYVDLTFGGGGHSKAILKKINKGKLVAFDQDEDAKANVFEKEQFLFISQNFRYLSRFLRLNGIRKVDGILADLGVSSHQFNEASRGFSFRFENERLDMRMNQGSQKSAAEVLNNYKEEDLSRIFFSYGELRSARKIAKVIVERRRTAPIETIQDLMVTVEPFIKKGNNKLLAQLFQSIRIEVNEELLVIEEFLQQSSEVLNEGGRLVVIAYHSLEDRLIKNYMKTGTFDGKPEKDLFGNFTKPFKVINKKVIVPSQEEIKQNPRSRSAKLRIAERFTDNNGSKEKQS